MGEWFEIHGIPHQTEDRPKYLGCFALRRLQGFWTSPMESKDVIDFLSNNNWILCGEGILYVPGFYPEVYEECKCLNISYDIGGV
jgi:hypothetical protein